MYLVFVYQIPQGVLYFYYMEEYIDTEIEINQACFEQDFDEVGYDPIEIDDSDEESAEMFGYNN